MPDGNNDKFENIKQVVTLKLQTVSYRQYDYTLQELIPKAKKLIGQFPYVLQLNNFLSGAYMNIPIIYSGN